MNRSTRFLIMGLMLLAMLPLMAAKPLQQGNQGVIQNPQENGTVRGVVTITGTATIADFQFYKVEWGRGANPNEWHLIGSTYPTQVSDGVLVQWDTTTVPDGVYTLRLQVVKMDGNYSEYYVRNIVVANKRPTETPTSLPQETPSPTPTQGPAGPTATLAIVQPTAALAQPSPTPTPVRPSIRTLPELPLIAWRESLCMGAGTMAAIFVVVGMVLALRRLL